MNQPVFKSLALRTFAVMSAVLMASPLWNCLLDAPGQLRVSQVNSQLLHEIIDVSGETGAVNPSSRVLSPVSHTSAEAAPRPRALYHGPRLPRARVFSPSKMFNSRRQADRRVMQANPRLYLFEDFATSARPMVVIGMPGWGGRSEKFIWTLINGLKDQQATRRVLVAAIQDTRTGGPRYQGQGDRAHANIWSLDRQGIQVLEHFVSTVARQWSVAPEVYLVGFSTGGAAAPLAAARLAGLAGDRYAVKGAVAIGTGSQVGAAPLKVAGIRVLFLTVPRHRRSDGKPLRDDQWNRRSAEASHKRLASQGAEVYLVHVRSARSHLDWHWGLISRCRFFPGKSDQGRGYWPNYQRPNPETVGALTAFFDGWDPVRGAGRPLLVGKGC